MLINAILLGHSQAKAMLTTGASQGFVKGVLGRAVTHVSSPLVVLPGGERLHPPGPHLQAVPQEHHRKGRSQHQEGALCCPSVGSVLLGVPLTELCSINVHIGGTGNKWQM